MGMKDGGECSAGSKLCNVVYVVTGVLLNPMSTYLSNILKQKLILLKPY
jgi:hypothetical protein